MYNEPKRKVRRPEAVKEMAHRRGNVRRKRSLMVRMFLLVCVTILGPSLLMLLVFYRTIPARMESQAKGNVNFYISQVTASVANTMELAQDIAYNAMIDDSLCASMQDLDMYLALQGRDDLLRVVGGVAAYQSTWKRGAVNSVYLFRRDGAFTFYSPRGSYEQEQRRMQSIYEAANEQSSAETLFSIENTPENTAYFLLDYKNIDTLEPLGKLIMEIDVDTLLNAGDLTELYPTHAWRSQMERENCYTGRGRTCKNFWSRLRITLPISKELPRVGRAAFTMSVSVWTMRSCGWIFLYHFRPCTIWFGRGVGFSQPCVSRLCC